MLDDFINQAATLMQEQAGAYRRLDSACGQLAAALVQGSPTAIESATRAGEGELLRMRARLVQLMSALSAFAEARAGAGQNLPISPAARQAFEAASGALLAAANDFQRTSARAAALATSGSSFAAACIEVCGVPPTTYRAPYGRRGDGRWA
jgi:hypothetical protein